MTIPNVATETSNLLGFHEEPERQSIMLTLKRLLQAFREMYIASLSAADQPEYRYLGLTDAALLVGAAGAVILSADAMLCIAAEKRGLQAINFNHLRDPAYSP